LTGSGLKNLASDRYVYPVCRRLRLPSIPNPEF
jgi:hypothetical protein